MQLSEIEKFQLLVIDDASFKQTVQQASTVFPAPCELDRLTLKVVSESRDF